jgi:hypothetical protein
MLQFFVFSVRAGRFLIFDYPIFCFFGAGDRAASTETGFREFFL